MLTTIILFVCAAIMLHYMFKTFLRISFGYILARNAKSNAHRYEQTLKEKRHER